MRGKTKPAEQRVCPRVALGEFVAPWTPGLRLVAVTPFDKPRCLGKHQGDIGGRKIGHRNQRATGLHVSVHVGRTFLEATDLVLQRRSMSDEAQVVRRQSRARVEAEWWRIVSLGRGESS